LYDVRVLLTMPGTIDDRIVIVDIDEASQVELGQWPWPRDTLATIVDHLFDDYSVKVLGFDVLFAEAEETSAERLLARIARSDVAAIPQVRDELTRLSRSLDSNSRFAESLIARDVVTGFVFKDFVAANEPEATGVLPEPLISSSALAGVSIPFVEARGFTGALPMLQGNAVTGGFFDSPVIDSDGVFRRAPLLQRYRGDLYASLSLAVTRLALGSPPVSLSFAKTRDDRLSGVELEALQLGERRIPVNEKVTVYIPFLGPQGRFPYGMNFFLEPSTNSILVKSVVADATTPFDVSTAQAWGQFSQPLDSVAVVPTGYLVGVNRANHKMEILELPPAPVDSNQAPGSVAFSVQKMGIGTRPGLLASPVALAVFGTTILILEEGNRRIQAVDVSANPVMQFQGQTASTIDLRAVESDPSSVVYLDISVEGLGFMYVLSYTNGGLAAADYRLDIYDPDGNFLLRKTGVAAARMVVDTFRNVYTLNYETIAGAPRVEPSLSQWEPSTPEGCPTPTS
jgi:hypothetical protein